MQSRARKRIVSSCIPCYTKKQKCNRCQPCNHCARRRRPEECTYISAPTSQTPQAINGSREDVPADDNAPLQGVSGSNGRAGTPILGQGCDSMAELYGYVQHSASNTMALVRRLDLDEGERPMTSQSFSEETLDEIEKNIRKLPDRETLDVLVQYFATEIHWMEQVVFLPWFLGQYEQWWSLERRSTVFHVEFAVLFLRICSYTSQFLPSPSYTIDRIRGVPLDDVRNACNDVADSLAAIAVRADARGALIRVQHLLLLGLQRQCEGRTHGFREAVGDAVRVAQRIGLHRGRAAWGNGLTDADMEIRCRTFCNLFVWDSLLSRQLDCPPFISTEITSEHLPYTHSSPTDDVPDGYSERVLQARLASFWRTVAPGQGSEYEPALAEKNYQKFCSDYLTQLPPAFALEPSTEWDERLPRLPLQRQILHVAIFEYLCYNFRPVLLHESAYQHMLVVSQKRALAAAAVMALNGVSELHSMLGNSHTRLPTIIMPTFEAAVVLVTLLMDANIPSATPSSDAPLRPLGIDPLEEKVAHLTRSQCRQAVRQALTRVEMLAEVSNMAKVGASTLGPLIARLANSGVD